MELVPGVGVDVERPVRIRDGEGLSREDGPPDPGPEVGDLVHLLQMFGPILHLDLGLAGAVGNCAIGRLRFVKAVVGGHNIIRALLVNLKL